MKKFYIVLLVAASFVGHGQTTNYVMNFNGAGNYVNLGTSVGNSIRSIEFWFKPNVTINSSTTIDGCSFVLRDDNQISEYGVYIRGTAWSSNIGQLSFYVRNSGALHEIFSNQSTWTAGTWYHVAAVIDPSAGMQLYINGVLQSSTDATQTTPIQIDNTNPTVLGKWGLTTIRYCNARMDELRFWSRAITQSEIQSKKCLNLTPSNETGLKGYWEFNEGSGSQILDATINGYNGTVNGATWIIDNPCPMSSGNYVMDFNGTGNYVNLGTSVGNGITSIEFWFKPTVTINSSTTIDGCSFVLRDDNQISEYGVYIRGTAWSSNIGQLSFYIRNSGSLHEIFSNQNSWTAGTWYHVASVVDPSAGMQLYINGVLQNNTDATQTTPIQVDNTNPTVLGKWGLTTIRYCNARMDELRFWSRAISQGEIQTKMCQNLNPSNETNLKAYWKFNEGSGSQILDTTTNGYNGTVNGATWINDNYCVSGIKNEQGQIGKIVVYPNPCSDVINIEMENFAQNSSYRLFNMVGIEIRSGLILSNSAKLDISDLASGIYNFIIMQNGKMHGVKVNLIR